MLFNWRKKTVIVLSFLAIHASATAKPVTLEMAYMPIVPCSQIFVMEGLGWTKKAGLNLKFTRFSNGPAIVQAIASGKMDVMCFGVGPAMVTRGKGIKIKVIAAGIINQIAAVGQGDFVNYVNKYGVTKALTKWRDEKGKKVRIASFPKGSVPDTVTRHWLINSLGLDINQVELVGMGAARVQQALLSRSVDAAGILEPILTIVQEKLNDAKVIAGAKDMMPGQPGSTIAARERIINEHRDALIKFVALHIKATNLLTNNPEKAAPLVKSFIGKGLLKEETILKALTSPASNFRSDPRKIIKDTEYMANFQKTRKINTKVSTRGLFDNTIYEAAEQYLKK